LKRSEDQSPTATPMSVLPPKIRQNCPIAENTLPALMGVVRKKETVRNKTIATASFSTASPNTFAYKLKSTCSCEKMASTVTGSVALIIDPKMRQSRKLMCTAKGTPN
jgi:hypothetical protein